MYKNKLSKRSASGPSSAVTMTRLMLSLMVLALLPKREKDQPILQLTQMASRFQMYEED
jgi:hypothetical protein